MLLFLAVVVLNLVWPDELIRIFFTLFFEKNLNICKYKKIRTVKCACNNNNSLDWTQQNIENIKKRIL